MNPFDRHLNSPRHSADSGMGASSASNGDSLEMADLKRQVVFLQVLGILNLHLVIDIIVISDSFVMQMESMMLYNFNIYNFLITLAPKGSNACKLIK